MTDGDDIVFADATAIEALGPYVEDVLDAMKELRPGMGGIFVSDLSGVSDFLDGEPTGETCEEPNPITGKPMTVVMCEWDTEKNRRFLAGMAEKLGVKVEMDDLIYEIARRLRDK